MSETEGVRVGLIGCGEQATKNLLPSLAKLGDVRLVSVCDLDRVKVERVARTAGIPHVCVDYREMFSKVSPDALILAGPPQMQFEIAKEALIRGVHVFAEKPPTATTAELEILADLADTRGLVTAVGHNFRYAKPYQNFVTVGTSPEFGKPMHVDILFLANKPRVQMWGLSRLRSMLLALAIHPLDLMLFWLGAVDALSVSVRPSSNDGILLTAHFHGKNVDGTLITGSCAPQLYFEMKLLSDASQMLLLDGLWQLELHGAASEPKGFPWHSHWKPSPLDSGHARSGYEGELQAFIDAVRGLTQTQPSFRDEISVYTLIDQIEVLADRNSLTIPISSEPKSDYIASSTHLVPK